MAQSFTVYAPEHPGITSGDEDSYKALDDMWDLVLYYYDLFDKLGLKAPAVVGHSFGGMIAGEIAATDPTRVGKLVLISPLGLWRDDSPIRNYIVTPQTELPALLFKDQHHPSLKRITLNPEDQQGFIRITWALGCTGKFMWPIPDKGLRKRLHRIAAPTLIVWGKDDKLLPAVYADEFRKGIPGAKVHLVADGAHMMPLEEPAQARRDGREVHQGLARRPGCSSSLADWRCVEYFHTGLSDNPCAWTFDCSCECEWIKCNATPLKCRVLPSWRCLSSPRPARAQRMDSQ